ncbi:S9 family peptidase [Glycomyces buryatensis]|uniref:S9 family peptidase n=1 Tax=Glycomyces buryatensis TaxID=2570927 RepID=A0A4S8QHL8_9ACTN|nr:S9 family peptidase [Glycomyces buryatensis]THV40899.1 S9 family peptidase [Glycomyces buryatensis]
MSDAHTTKPVAPRREHPRTHHGDTVNDAYAWLKDSEDPAVRDYLEAENAHTETQTAHLAGLRKTIFGEIKDRTQETDLSVPTREHGWWYYGRTEEGKQYSQYCRVAVEGDTPPEIEPGTEVDGEQVILDGNVLAEGHDFFSIGAAAVSPDGNLLAFSVNFSGDERFTLRFKDLRTGEVRGDEVVDTFYGGTWAADGEHYFYTKVDDAWRPHQVWRHRLGQSEDVLVYQEDDQKFRVGIDLTRSEEYLVLYAASTLTTEIRFLSAADPTGEFQVFGEGRVEGVEFEIDHQGDRFLVLHNRGAENFTLGWVPVADTRDWHELIAHHPERRITSADAFRDFAVVSMREGGLTKLSLLRSDGELEAIEFDEPIYTVRLGDTPEFDARQIRLSYTSLVTPGSVFDYDVPTGELLLRKQTPVLGDFDPADYRQYREWATAEDGTRIPISIVARKDAKADGTNPALLYGYGSYEISVDPYFSIARLSLLDRGVVFAVAHIRGGGEMGRAWYDSGKMLHKMNTFTDFVACADHLVSSGWAAPDRIVARGGSAGGLLMGAIANLAPDRFAGVLAEVPFVDALNTILDPSMPLTVGEWEEWGNPLDSPDVYAYMKTYSPYENIADVPYPPILAVTSLNDTRVGFHEPAKWIAQLRYASPESDVMLKTEMEAGHGGRSGRYDAWEEEAFNLAWVLDRLGEAQTA